MRFADDSAMPVRTFGPKPAAESSRSHSYREIFKNEWRACIANLGRRDSDGRDAVREISSGEKCWSCSGITLQFGSSGTLSRGAGRGSETGAGVKPYKFRRWLFGRDPICNLIADLGAEIDKSDAHFFFRFRLPHDLRGDFDSLL